MSALNNKEMLRAKIIRLENQRDTELNELKVSFRETRESLRPINLLKKTFSTSIKHQTVTDSISGILIGLTTGYLVKKNLFKKSDNILMNTIAMLVQSLVTSEAVKHSDEISSSGADFLTKIYKTIIDLYHKYKEIKSEISGDDIKESKEEYSTQMGDQA